MARDIVLDETIFEQINLGNPHVAKRLRDLFDQGAKLWTTHEVNSQFRTQADRRLANDLRIQAPLQDSGMVERYRNRLDAVPARSIRAAALALHLKGEVMTMNKSFDAAFTPNGVVPGMRSIQNIPGHASDFDFVRARKLLGLSKLTITGNGAILPTPMSPLGKPARVIAPSVAVTGPRTAGGARTTGPSTTAHVGDRLQAPSEFARTPSPKVDAASTLGLQGVNKVVHYFNDRIEKKKFDEAWAKIKPSIDAILDEDPNKGCMLFIYYSKRQKTGAEKESPMDHVSVFQAIVPVFAYTAKEAWVNLAQMPARAMSAGPGDVISDPQWFPPKRTILDIRNMPSPFEAAGIATFVPGRARLVRVKFSGTSGFDDKMISVEELSVPAGVIPRFYFLFPPNEITYFDHGRHQSVDIDYDDIIPAEVVADELRTYAVPAVELDSWANPGSAKAAMVYPADNATANLFQKTHQTFDNTGLLRMHRNMHLIRWVKPQNMRVLKNFRHDQEHMPTEEATLSTRMGV